MIRSRVGPGQRAGALEQFRPLHAVARGQRQQQILLAGEVPVEGADGVFAFLGDPRHLQVQQPLALDQLLRLVEKQGFPARELALLAVLDGHGGEGKGRWGGGEGARMMNRVHFPIKVPRTENPVTPVRGRARG